MRLNMLIMKKIVHLSFHGLCNIEKINSFLVGLSTLSQVNIVQNTRSGSCSYMPIELRASRNVLDLDMSSSLGVVEEQRK